MSDHDLDDLKSALNSALVKIGSIEEGLEDAFADLRETEIRIRRARSKFFPSDYFADVAWDVLLELDKAERLGRVFSVSDVGLDAGIPLSTLLRYVAKLESDGFLVRAQDPCDGRRVHVSLTDLGRSALEKVFEAGAGARAKRSEHRIAANDEASMPMIRAGG